MTANGPKIIANDFFQSTEVTETRMLGAELLDPKAALTPEQLDKMSARIIELGAKHRLGTYANWIVEVAGKRNGRGISSKGIKSKPMCG